MAKNNEAVEGNSQTNAAGVEFDATRLIDGIRDFFLRSVRENGMKKPWQKMSEGEQNLEIERATERAEELLQAVVDIVATADFPVVHAIIDNYQSKNGEVKIVAKGVADDEVILNLHHAGKKAVKIVIADRRQFDTNRVNLKGDPDQLGLPGVKLDLSADEVNGKFDDDVEEPKPDTEQADGQGGEPFADEQEEGAAVLDGIGKVHIVGEAPADHGPITDMRGFPEGPMQAMRDGKRWWSDDGMEWREATDDDVLPADMDDVKQVALAFDPDEPLPGVDDLEDPAQDLANETGMTVIEESPDVTEPDPELTEQQQADVAASGADTDGVVSEPDLTKTLEEIEEEGHKARTDGKGPKSNPYTVDLDKKAWLSGYNKAKKAEAAKDAGGDVGFDD